MFADGGPCAANALFCDNFEEYTFMPPPPPLDLTEMVPNWDQFHFHGYPRADTAKAYVGKQAAHFDTEASSYRFAAFIHQTHDGTAAVPLNHFGRVWVWLKALPPTAQWSILEVQGPLAGSTNEATYGFGGYKGHLAASYAQRKRFVDADGGVTLRPGAPQSAAEGTMINKLECTKTAATMTFTPAKWVCVEWNIDAVAGAMHLWLDGVAQTEIDVAGQGTECTVGMPATPWQAPSVLTKVNLVWESYNGADSPQQEGWFDEFAIGTQRIGCQ
jgi:hypothetical protein